MSLPGQNIEALLQNVGVDELRKLIGTDVAATLQALNDGVEDTGKLRAVAVRLFEDQPIELFSRSDVLASVYGAMTPGKFQELADRTQLTPRELRGDVTRDPAIFSKFLGFFGLDAGSAAHAASEPSSEIAKASFGLFPHQRRAASRVWDTVGSGYGRVVLHMPTGAGKTRTAMHIIARCLIAAEPGVVVWLANSRELLDQAAEALQHSWLALGNREISLIRFWGAHEPALDDITDGVVVAGFQKMHAWVTKNPILATRLAAKTRLVVVDEAHQAIAPTYRAVIDKLSNAGKFDAVVGLSATPGRTWSDIVADAELAAFFGERKVMLEVEGYPDPVSFLMAEGYLARPEFRTLQYKEDEELAKKCRKATLASGDYDDDTLDALAENAQRNVCIVNEIKQLIDEGHKRIIVFGASVRHAELLAATVSAFSIADARIVTGATPLNKRRRAINEFRSPGRPMVLCNFGVLTTGFDAPNTSAAIIARPTRSLVLYSQMVGRATRGPKAGGNECCVVSTVVDIDLPGFGDVAEAFTNWEDVWDESK